MEHSGFSIETVKQSIRYFEAAHISMIVRVPSKEYNHIARVCDMGAEGIMLPMVNNATEARHILDSMKYFPDGKRGVALGVAHDNYLNVGTVAERLTAANHRSTLFCQIETAEGVDNADAIAALDGVDCLWVGHFDLSASLGIPGDFNNKIFTDAIAKVAAATRKHGKALGRLVPNVETGIEYNKIGFDFICYSGDVWILQAALSDAVDKLRASCLAK
jgi:2-keto-3-deoxy-L-rhamnonate aldolase RhmA